MHESIRESLEGYLRGSAGKVPQEFHVHLAQCAECASEVRLLESQSRMLRSLQASQEMEPRAGFYARVMERIEQQRPASIWSVLLEPSFGRRLAMASAAIVLTLGAYLVTVELADPEIAQAPTAIVATAPDAQVVVADRGAENAPAAVEAQQQQRRDAVLVNLASFRQ